ncbi:MAG: 16S rRNA processing protein RimM [Tenericutes bacterium]|nr:16S rRNA processing protein RimM [Mycoplasmatota bacterium]
MEYLKIGKILNTRGIRGELKIKPFTDFQTDRYKLGKTIFIFFNNEYLEFVVKQYRPHKNMDLLVLKDNEDINLIEKFKGCEIFVPADEETTLFENEYHLSEIIDLEVFQDDILIGHISDVKSYPQCDYLEIKTLNDVKKLIPFLDEFVLNIDLEEERVDLINMEGLL